MLPILRILPVGGVLLAIFILVLALISPDGSRPPLSPEVVPARSAFLDRDHRPEARQFLIHAALKRADELNRLRDLPDVPAQPVNRGPKMAGLPADRSESDPDEPASMNATPGVGIPFEAEPSPDEVPVAAPEANAQATKNPERTKAAQHEIRRRTHRARNTRPATVPQPRPFNLFDALFGGPQYQQPTYGSQQQPAYASQPYQQPTYGSQQQPAYANQPYQQPTYGRQQQPAYASQPYQQSTYGNQHSVHRNQSAIDVARQSNPSAFSTIPRTNPY
jgi:hypothetical protein